MLTSVAHMSVDVQEAERFRLGLRPPSGKRFGQSPRQTAPTDLLQFAARRLHLRGPVETKQQIP